MRIGSTSDMTSMTQRECRPSRGVSLLVRPGLEVREPTGTPLRLGCEPTGTPPPPRV